MGAWWNEEWVSFEECSQEGECRRNGRGVGRERCTRGLARGHGEKWV